MWSSSNVLDLSKKVVREKIQNTIDSPSVTGRIPRKIQTADQYKNWVTIYSVRDTYSLPHFNLVGLFLSTFELYHCFI